MRESEWKEGELWAVSLCFVPNSLIYFLHFMNIKSRMEGRMEKKVSGRGGGGAHFHKLNDAEVDLSCRASGLSSRCCF
jgi:hypothetical protein